MKETNKGNIDIIHKEATSEGNNDNIHKEATNEWNNVIIPPYYNDEETSIGVNEIPPRERRQLVYLKAYVTCQ